MGDLWGVPLTVPEMIRWCDGTVYEARLRFRHGEAREVRIVVAFTDVETASKFRTALGDTDATVEGNPSGLAGGRPLPPGFVVTFSVPASSGQALLALAP